MSVRPDIVYFDPGCGRNLTGVDTTYVEDNTYNPVNGVSFTSTSAGDVVVPIPMVYPGLPTTSYNAIHVLLNVRFSVYLELSDSATFRAAIKPTNNGVLYPVVTFDSSSHGFHNVALSKYMFWQYVAGSTTQSRYLDTRVDTDGMITNRSGNTYTAPPSDYATSLFGNLTFSFPNPQTSTCYVSNIILAGKAVVTPTSGANIIPYSTIKDGFSSAEIPVRLPLGAPDTDFTTGTNGEYISNASGQKLLQTVNASDVITKYGGTSKVSHLIVYGNPGYRVGSVITSATGISKENDTIAAHGVRSLSTDTDDAAFVGWETTDGTRLSDIDGLQLGWQV